MFVQRLPSARVPAHHQRHSTHSPNGKELQISFFGSGAALRVSRGSSSSWKANLSVVRLLLHVFGSGVSAAAVPGASEEQMCMMQAIGRIPNRLQRPALSLTDSHFRRCIRPAVPHSSIVSPVTCTHASRKCDSNK